MIKYCLSFPLFTHDLTYLNVTSEFNFLAYTFSFHWCLIHVWSMNRMQRFAIRSNTEWWNPLREKLLLLLLLSIPWDFQSSMVCKSFSRFSFHRYLSTVRFATFNIYCGIRSRLAWIKCSFSHWGNRNREKKFIDNIILIDCFK